MKTTNAYGSWLFKAALFAWRRFCAASDVFEKVFSQSVTLKVLNTAGAYIYACLEGSFAFRIARAEHGGIYGGSGALGAARRGFNYAEESVLGVYDGSVTCGMARESGREVRLHPVKALSVAVSAVIIVNIVLSLAFARHIGAGAFSAYAVLLVLSAAAYPNETDWETLKGGSRVISRIKRCRKKD